MPPPKAIARWKHYEELTSGILPYAMEIANKVGAAYSLELRYPFSDRRLIEFCLALPPQQKLRRGWGRSIVRRALTNLPDKVRWRPDKGNLGYNFKQSLISYEQDRLNEILFEKTEHLKPFVNLSHVKASYLHLLNEGQQAEGDPINTVWLSATLALWLEFTGIKAPQTALRR